MRILIVDDSFADRMMLRTCIEQEAMETTEIGEVASADEAIVELEREEYDAIFLDINMPGQDGFHVLKTVREKAQSSWPAIFMWSSSSHPGDIEQSYNNMATAYVTKSDTLEDLKRCTSACLNFIDVCTPQGNA